MNLSIKTSLELLGLRLRSKFAVLKAGPSPSAILTKTDQGLFVSDPSDMIVGRVLRTYGSYEPATLGRLKAGLDPQSRVLVVGAHIGALAVPLSKYCAEMLAYEPNPKTFRLLTMNIGLNRIENCRAFNLAAGEREGEIAFLANTVNSGGSKRKPLVDSFLYTYDSPEILNVPMVSLDAHIANHNFDLIVMDIEGSEFFALSGMQDILANSRHLQMEFIADHLDNVSGVSNQELLDLISPHFDRVRLQPDGDEIQRADFIAFLDELRSADRSGDLLFSK